MCQKPGGGGCWGGEFKRLQAHLENGLLFQVRRSSLMAKPLLYARWWSAKVFWITVSEASRVYGPCIHRFWA